MHQRDGDIIIALVVGREYHGPVLRNVFQPFTVTVHPAMRIRVDIHMGTYLSTMARQPLSSPAALRRFASFIFGVSTMSAPKK